MSWQDATENTHTKEGEDLLKINPSISLLSLYFWQTHDLPTKTGNKALYLLSSWLGAIMAYAENVASIDLSLAWGALIALLMTDTQPASGHLWFWATRSTEYCLFDEFVQCKSSGQCKCFLAPTNKVSLGDEVAMNSDDSILASLIAASTGKSTLKNSVYGILMNRWIIGLRVKDSDSSYFSQKSNA